jgi:DNA-3-methyladenine glycosylase II
MIPEYWRQAARELSERDEVIHKLIQHSSGSALNSHGDAFISLARSIIGQQISIKAAATIWQRLTTVAPKISPTTLLGMDGSILRNCGISIRKITYLQDLSQYFISERFDEALWKEAEDEALIAELTQVKGIGRWTAEMFLIFHMLRPNVLPLDDLGLQRAISLYYNDSQPVSRLQMVAIARPWQPWCSVATWYLWRGLDPIPVEY